MNVSRPHSSHQDSSPEAGLSGQESAVVVLRELEEERGRLFTEREYQEMRQAVLEELAFGMRLRPFTWLTFATVGLGLLALVVVGVVTSPGHRVADFALAIISGVALLSGAVFFWSLVNGVEKDRLRSLDERLGELEELRKLILVNDQEYQDLRSYILHLRQHARVVRSGARSAQSNEPAPSRSPHR
jgi:hypothetical protein